ncbi:di-heme oxidoredictase family protein [Pandoraea pulmonicola]|uniref:Thiol oxidoreductase n=1 Tax=Pandoraea pulmonicola TaxID=93221 RepID=A0AAJ5D365_PANPU|nr:di-heme oxidoredictase family protein [Pandoraea pulmonicola]AJC22431.1 thiol oxidoreductase [Pandoraea pulmonicola]SUA93442.1 Predicted thiol oxidoreductase [Pandoraea pulmonicola]
MSGLSVRWRTRLGAALLSGMLSSHAGAQTAGVPVTREAFGQPMAFASEEGASLTQFAEGRALFRQSWVVYPSSERRIAGLGPVYNQISCIACHVKFGRGNAPVGPDEAPHGLLVRLSVPGKTATGAPREHPDYGDQLGDKAIPGVPAEGQVRVHYTTRSESLAGGEIVTLRVPQLRFTDLAFGSLGHGTMTSARVGSPVYGLGWLEAVDDGTLHALAARRLPDGVRGKVNRVWDATAKRQVVGRFGWKANQPTIRQQIASAFVGDLGVTSTVYPTKSCPAVQTACRAAPTDGQPDLTDAQLDAVEYFQRTLEVPARRDVDDPRVMRGERGFAQAGCAACHVSVLRTGAFPPLAAMANRDIAPYTDMLLHDMGTGLADGRPDFLAGPRDWRTPPLWGLGLAVHVNPDATFLHDGRARTLQEAILWHGGEARVSRERFRAMSPQARADLLRFLMSL